jgi:DNA processing protein
MNSQEMFDWLTLFHDDSIPLSLVRNLLVASATPGGFRESLQEFCNSDNETGRLLHQALRSAGARARADSALLWSHKEDNRLLLLTDPLYPPLLREIADPPPLLFVRGNADALQLPQIAVVGSRRGSVDGRENTAMFSREIVNKGLGVCSGLATGIDTVAHTAALDAGGITNAVLGTGIDQIYPRSNARLASRILVNGALVSEFPLSYPALPVNFPRRNRIISGLSIGVLVVEAALQSGSLVTARMAMEQNREVFAVPGTIRNPYAQGCHRLIREGATLAGTPDDLWATLDGLLELSTRAAAAVTLSKGLSSEAPRAGSFTQAQRELLAQLGFEPASLDLIAARTGRNVLELQAELLLLELAGVVRAEAGRYVLRGVAPLQGL